MGKISFDWRVQQLADPAMIAEDMVMLGPGPGKCYEGLPRSGQAMSTPNVRLMMHSELTMKIALKVEI